MQLQRQVLCYIPSATEVQGRNLKRRWAGPHACAHAAAPPAIDGSAVVLRKGKLRRTASAAGRPGVTGHKSYAASPSGRERRAPPTGGSMGCPAGWGDNCSAGWWLQLGPGGEKSKWCESGVAWADGHPACRTERERPAQPPRPQRPKAVRGSRRRVVPSGGKPWTGVAAAFHGRWAQQPPPPAKGP